MSRSELKARAKESLKGHYKEAIKLYLIYVLISFVGSIVIGSVANSETSSSILELIFSICIVGLYMGYYNFCYSSVKELENK